MQPSSPADPSGEHSAMRADAAEPAWVFLQLCQGGALSSDQVVRIPAAKASQFARTLRTLDLIGHLETHTVGVVYAAPGQKTEAEMLANQYGSERYARFLRQLGGIVPISEDSSPGGLSEKDGHFTYVYDDPVTQVVFHVATLMPTNESDVACNAKKRYIGNDFVTIVYNDSGHPYRLGTISGKFAHVAIIVVPQDDETLSITLLAKDEISRWLAAKRALLKDNDAASLCRKMAMRAQLSVNVWRTQEAASDPPYLNMAVERYRKIKQLRERYTAAPILTKTFIDAL
uniref:Rap-GAP domain-containing protein n=1 Tax=Plectus sambesii TaxID=2011161 RepID=A0A914XJZ0_9BILA